MLKPDIGLFSARMCRKEPCGRKRISLVDGADTLLVAGSSLTVYSGFRFVRHGRGPLGIPDCKSSTGARRAATTLRTVKIDSRLLADADAVGR